MMKRFVTNSTAVLSLLVNFLIWDFIWVYMGQNTIWVIIQLDIYNLSGTYLRYLKKIPSLF